MRAPSSANNDPKVLEQAAQKVYAGETIHGCNVVFMLTNNYFTDGAKKATRAVGIEF